MKNKTSKPGIDWIGKSFQTGHVNVSVNGKKVGDVTLEHGLLKIDILADLKTTIPMNKVPSKMKELSIAHSISRFFSSIGLRIDVWEDGKEIASLGKGVHSLLGNVKLKVSRLRKIM